MHCQECLARATMWIKKAAENVDKGKLDRARFYLSLAPQWIEASKDGVHLGVPPSSLYSADLFKLTAENWPQALVTEKRAKTVDSMAKAAAMLGKDHEDAIVMVSEPAQPQRNYTLRDLVRVTVQETMEQGQRDFGPGQQAMVDAVTRASGLP